MIDATQFISQFRELYVKSPQCGSWTRASENCNYGDITTVSKDCYMCFNSGNCRDAYYCEDCRALKDCIDCAFCESCELCYECTDCDTCYNSNFCQDCNNCNNIQFSYDLRRCKDCFGCVTIRDKQYCIFNEQYSKENYEKKIKELNLEEVEAKVDVLKLKTPRMYVHQFDTTDCTGDYIYHSKNCHACFDTRHTEDSGYIIQANLDMGTRDSYDCGPIPTGMDLCYDCSYSHYLFNCDYVYWCGNLKDCKYCINCLEGENLFGCHYLQNKQNAFYILNEKVSEKDYRETTAKLQKELYEKGIYNLYDLLNKDINKEKENISDEQKERKCIICGEVFVLTDAEIEFYKKRRILFPVYCPQCRATQRINMRNERKMYKRICDCCKNTLITTYPPDSKFTVYCLDCWYKNIG